MSTANRQLKDARAALAAAKAAKKLHRKLCRTCTQFTGTRARWCDEGWAIEKAIRDGEQLLGQLTQESAGQGVLFGRSEAGSATG